MAGVGAFRERVTIERPVTVTDSQGGRSTTWTSLATVWASVQPARAGDESLQASAVRARQDYQVELHYRGDVTPDMRLRWTPYRGADARVLQIVGVSLDRRARLLLHVSEVR